MADNIKDIPVRGNQEEKIRQLENNIAILRRALNDILNRLKKAGL